MKYTWAEIIEELAARATEGLQYAKDPMLLAVRSWLLEQRAPGEDSEQVPVGPPGAVQRSGISEH